MAGTANVCPDLGSRGSPWGSKPQVEAWRINRQRVQWVNRGRPGTEEGKSFTGKETAMQIQGGRETGSSGWCKRGAQLCTLFLKMWTPSEEQWRTLKGFQQESDGIKVMFWMDCSGVYREKWLEEAKWMLTSHISDKPLWRTIWCFFYKVKHASTLWPSNFILRYLSKLNENICSQKYLYKNFYSSHICKSKKYAPPTTQPWQISIKRCFQKQTVMYLYNDYYLAIQMQTLLIYTAWIIHGYTVWFHSYGMKLTYQKTKVVVIEIRKRLLGGEGNWKEKWGNVLVWWKCFVSVCSWQLHSV